MIYPVGERSGIYCIEGAGPARVYFVTAPEPLLIDAGAVGQGEVILRSLASLGIRPLDIKKIIVTHHHANHAGGLWELHKRSGAKLYAHANDADLIRGRKPRRAARRGLSKVYHYAVDLVGPVDPRPVDLDGKLRDGDMIAGLRVIHTPGHTPGHICLLRGPVLFSGDLLEATSGGFRETPHTHTSDLATSRQSIRMIAKFDFAAILSGHRPPYVVEADAKVRELAEKLGAWA